MTPADNQQTLQLAFNLAPVGMCVSRDRTVEICNEAFARMFGYDAEELVGKPLAPLYPSLDVARKLGISPRTVEAHRARLMKKFEATTNGELVARLVGGA
jgi:PAS domain S-box-containing protein